MNRTAGQQLARRRRLVERPSARADAIAAASSASARLVSIAAVALSLSLALGGCATPAAGPDAPSPATSLGPDLDVARLAPGVWLHTSWREFPGGTRFPSHGLLVDDGARLWLVDTAWGSAPTEVLLAWIDAELARPIAGAVLTHFHDDRLGGLSALAARRVPAFAAPLTIALAPPADGARLLPLPALAEAGGTSRLGPLEVFACGPAHTRDNVVVVVPEARVLFGGCAVRPATSDELGNVADADLARWPDAIRAVRARYANRIDVVVPSHGPAAGPELLDHTLAVLATTP